MRRSSKIYTTVLLCLCVAGPLPAAMAAHPLETALLDSAPFYGSDAELAFARTRAAGATAIRLGLSWREVAPTTRTTGFDPTSPADPAYRFEPFDRAVQLAAAHGLMPFVGISEAPSWAERGSGGRAGTNRPDPVELGRFAEAAARRYSGGFGGLPRVGRWEVWNEPNATFFLYPQEENHRPVSPAHYREMVNSFAAGVHRVHADNVVIAGGLFPFVLQTASAQAIGPLRFMRELLCMSKRLRPKRGCGEPVHFDTWSHHPYTSGGPSHRASNPDSVSIRELPRMRRLLRAAVRFERIVHNRPVAFWVSEFSWDSNPPDPGGVPSGLHARWVTEALYRMWRAGVSLVTWFQLRDDAANGRPDNQVFQSGLYARCSAGLRCDRPKLALEAFRFPFVAFRAGGRVSVWGRTPSGRPATVVVEQAVRRHWKRLASLRTNSRGLFRRRLRTSRRGRLRARLEGGGPVAVPFSLDAPRDRRASPFG